VSEFLILLGEVTVVLRKVRDLSMQLCVAVFQVAQLAFEVTDSELFGLEVVSKGFQLVSEGLDLCLVSCIAYWLSNWSMLNRGKGGFRRLSFSHCDWSDGLARCAWG
jgi:hypothetical protein